MSRCATCNAPTRSEIERQMRAGVPDSTLSAWTKDHEPYISRLALGKHRREHLGVDTKPGRKPPTGDFLQAVVEDAHEGLISERYRGGVALGIQAQKLLDARTERQSEAEWQAMLVAALTGQPRVRVLSPDEERQEAIAAWVRAGLSEADAIAKITEGEAVEADYLALLPGGELAPDDDELRARDRREVMARLDGRGEWQ